MASILRPFPGIVSSRIQTPIGAVGVDWTNPLTANLVGAYLPGVSVGRNLAGLPPDLTQGSSYKSIGLAEGHASQDNASLNSGMSGPAAPAFVAQSRFTVYFRGEKFAFSGGQFGIQAGVSFSSSVSNAPGYQYVIASSDGSGNNFQLKWNTAGGQTTGSDFAQPAQFSTLSLGGTYRAGGNAIAYSNGTQQVSNTFGAGAAQDNGGYVCIAQNPGQSINANAASYMALFWNRELSAAEMLAIHLDPYQFLIGSEYEMPALSSGVTAVVVGWMPGLDPAPRIEKYIDVNKHTSPVHTYRSVPAVGVSGVPWSESWTPPRFRDVASKTDQHPGPAQPYQSIPAVGVSGVPWSEKWTPPRFRDVASKSEQHPGPAIALTPDTLPVPISGIAYHRPWEDPRFLPLSQDKHTQPVLANADYAVLTAGVSGQAYSQQWEPPRFGPVDIGKHKDIAISLTPATLPVAISGSAWYTPWQPIRFPDKVATEQHKTQAFVNLFTAATISGSAWYQPFEPPRFYPFRSADQQTSIQSIAPSTFPAGVSGQAYSQQWEPPRFWPYKAEQQNQNFATQTGFFLPSIGPSGIEWSAPIEQPRFGPLPPDRHVGISFTFTAFTVPTGIEGMAWEPMETEHKFEGLELERHNYGEPIAWFPDIAAPVSGASFIEAWREPLFPTRVPPWLYPAESSKSLPSTFPANVSGQAYSQQWEPPFFSTSYKFQEVPGEAPWLGTSVAIGLSGVSWSQQWEPPFFPIRFPANQQQTTLQVIDPHTFPASVDGMAWFKPWELTPQKITAHFEHQTELLSWAAFPIFPAGMWWGPFDQPQIPQRISLDKHTDTPRQLPPNFVQITVAGQAWSQAWELPLPMGYKHWQHLTEQRSPPPLFTISPLPADMWFKTFEPPRFEALRQDRHTQPSPFPPSPMAFVYAPFIMPWAEQWTPPRFGPFIEPPQPAQLLIPGTLPTGVSGIAWQIPISEPFFERRYRPFLEYFNTQQDLRVPAVGLPPFDWSRPWETPIVPPVGMRHWQHKTEAFASWNLTQFYVSSLTHAQWPAQHTNAYPRYTTPTWDTYNYPGFYGTQVSGMAWQVPLSEPAFVRNLAVNQNQTESYVERFLPVGISGIAWFRPFEDPTTFPRNTVASRYQMTEAGVLIPSTVPVAVSGMAWWQPVSQPSFRGTTFPSAWQQTELFTLVVPVISSGVIAVSGWMSFFGTRNIVGMQVACTTNPLALKIRLQGSFDSYTWGTIATWDTAAGQRAGDIVASTGLPVQFVRVIIDTMTGTGITVTVTILPMEEQSWLIDERVRTILVYSQ